jgi:hypothetical protein
MAPGSWLVHQRESDGSTRMLRPVKQ